MSFGWIVTRPAWIAQTFTSSNIVTRNDSEASWRARMAVLWKRREGSMFWATSLTNVEREISWSTDQLTSDTSGSHGERLSRDETDVVYGHVLEVESPFYVRLQSCTVHVELSHPYFSWRIVLSEPWSLAEVLFEFFLLVRVTGKIKSDGIVQKTTVFQR